MIFITMSGAKSAKATKKAVKNKGTSGVAQAQLPTTNDVTMTAQSTTKQILSIMGENGDRPVTSTPVIAVSADGVGDVSDKPIQWTPEDAEAWALYVPQADELAVLKNLFGTPGADSSCGAQMVSILAERKQFQTRGALERTLKQATLAVPLDRLIEDVRKPGTLCVWPERVRDNGKWAVAKRWEGRRGLAALAEHMRSLAPSCKLALTNKHGRSALYVQVEGNELGKVLACKGVDEYQAEMLTSSTMSTMFLEITAKEDERGSITAVAFKTMRTIEARYPKLVWIGSKIPDGARMIAMLTEGEFTLGDALDYMDTGVHVVFKADGATPTQAKEIRKENAALAKSVVSKITHVLVEQGKATHGPNFLSEKEETVGDMGEDEEVEEEVRDAARRDIVAHAARADKASKTVLAKLTACKVPREGREAAAALVAKVFPQEEARADAFIEKLATIDGPGALWKATESLDPAVVEARASFAEVMRRTASTAGPKAFADQRAAVPTAANGKQRQAHGKVTFATHNTSRSYIRGDTEVIRRSGQRRRK